MGLGVERREYGEVDLWGFDLMEVGGELPCGGVRTFLNYLISERTRSVSIRSYSAPKGTLTATLTGPRADDGRFLSISYVLSREEVHKVLTAEEKHLLVRCVEEFNPTGRDPWWFARKAFLNVLNLSRAA